jgi:hypothetical protein
MGRFEIWGLQQGKGCERRAGGERQAADVLLAELLTSTAGRSQHRASQAVRSSQAHPYQHSHKPTHPATRTRLAPQSSPCLLNACSRAAACAASGCSRGGGTVRWPLGLPSSAVGRGGEGVGVKRAAGTTCRVMASACGAHTRKLALPPENSTRPCPASCQGTAAGSGSRAGRGAGPGAADAGSTAVADSTSAAAAAAPAATECGAGIWPRRKRQGAL